jgi:hypothetical protein
MPYSGNYFEYGSHLPLNKILATGLTVNLILQCTSDGIGEKSVDSCCFRLTLFFNQAKEAISQYRSAQNIA